MTGLDCYTKVGREETIGVPGMIPRELGLHFAIDTNRINARQGLPSMNRLERWKEDGVISILMPESAYAEALRGADAKRLLKTRLMIFSINTLESPDELELRGKVEKIICPSGRPDASTANDIDIIVNAHKYGCILITADGGSRSQPGGILGRHKELLALGIRVVSDAEAVALVEQCIRSRDEAAIKSASVQQEEPPAWVGEDL